MRRFPCWPWREVRFHVPTKSSQMMNLAQYREQRGLPEKAQLLQFSPEEAAQVALHLLPHDGTSFVPGDYIAYAADHAYGRDPEVDRVLAEGVGYLERYGLLIEEWRAYSGSGRGRTLSRLGRELAHSQEGLGKFLASVKDARALLHPAIIATALPLFDKGPDYFDAAVSVAFKRVEVAVRTAASLSDSEVGQTLMNRAFGPTGKLRDTAADGGEEDALRALFAGAMGYLRNPPSHREIAWPGPLTVLRRLVIASELLHIVEERAESE